MPGCEKLVNLAQQCASFARAGIIQQLNPFARTKMYYIGEAVLNDENQNPPKATTLYSFWLEEAFFFDKNVFWDDDYNLALMIVNR